MKHRRALNRLVVNFVNTRTPTKAVYLIETSYLLPCLSAANIAFRYRLLVLLRMSNHTSLSNISTCSDSEVLPHGMVHGIEIEYMHTYLFLSNRAAHYLIFLLEDESSYHLRDSWCNLVEKVSGIEEATANH